mmetsp:Transcript_36930/g.71569  ORF Transcript_36930/g.71569 Transcript_36930/m.71569 type:complete len:109 (+) Transcript_36930:270-596(+)
MIFSVPSAVEQMAMRWSPPCSARTRTGLVIESRTRGKDGPPWPVMCGDGEMRKGSTREERSNTVAQPVSMPTKRTWSGTAGSGRGWASSVEVEQGDGIGLCTMVNMER